MADHSNGTHPEWVDAIVRAWRTFYVSVGIDILATIGAGLMTLLNGNDVLTAAFWLAAAGLVTRSVVTGIATYFVRLKFPPK
jgi:hypothetical protein